MKMSCILEGLKEKKYINFKTYEPPLHLKAFPVYQVKSLVGKEFREELCSAIKENDEYIFCGENKNKAYIIAKTEDIDYWAEEILSEEIVDVRFGYPTSKQLERYIENKGFTMYLTCYEFGDYEIVNDKIQLLIGGNKS